MALEAARRDVLERLAPAERADALAVLLEEQDLLPARGRHFFLEKKACGPICGSPGSRPPGPPRASVSAGPA